MNDTKHHILADLDQQFARGALSRREFIRNAVVAGVSAGVAMSMAGRVLAATPKHGGHLRLGFDSGSTGDTLDPALLDSVYNQTLGYGSLRNTLTEVTNTNDLGPDLAESWEASADARTWVFNLKQGVEFHNGKSMTAADVIASLDYHRGEGSKSPAKALLGGVTAIKADGKHRVIVELSSGNADFPFAMTDYHLCIVPAEDGSVDATSGIGTGPFTLDSFEPGVRAALRRNPNYFKDGRPWFDSVELLSLKDVSARTNALLTGEVDAINSCDLKTVHLLKRRSGITVNSVTGQLHYTMPMDTRGAPFDNVDVRTALKYAVDRESLLEKVLNGYGTVGNDHPISPTMRYFAKDLEQRKYDPDKARFHLKKAGIDSLKVTLHAANVAFAGSGALDTAILFSEHARAASIDLTVKRVPDDGYFSNVWMVKPFTMGYWGGRPTEDMMFSTAYAADAAWNDTWWKNERFNTLLLEARSTLDDAKRHAMYEEMQMLVRDDGGTIIPLFANFVGGQSDALAHGPIAGNYDMDGFKIGERWWFA